MIIQMRYGIPNSAADLRSQVVFFPGRNHLDLDIISPLSSSGCMSDRPMS